MPETASSSAQSRPNPGKTPEEKKSSRAGAFKEIVMIVLVALMISFLVKTFIMRAFYIPSGSMENTLEIGDRVFVNKMIDSNDLKRGDIVVFADDANWQQRQGSPNPVRQALEWVGLFPGDGQSYLVKRIIGVPGDRVQAKGDGSVSVNGKKLSENYLYPGDQSSTTPFDVVVPEGKLWVMGDHRSRSADSRFHMGEESKGFVSKDSVEGRAWFIAFPFDRITGLKSGEEVFKDVPAP